LKGWVVQMRKGLVELCVLSVLREGEAYGYQILQRLATADCLAFGESSVYPILARLTEEGYIKMRIGPSPSGPPRRYYHLTALGQSRLREMRLYWADVQGAVDQLYEDVSNSRASKQRTSGGSK
jgi:PadR family transcriptional regulator PadR